MRSKLLKPNNSITPNPPIPLLKMHNQNRHRQNSPPPAISPRISFSHDFADTSTVMDTKSDAPPPSSDFEFLPFGAHSAMSGADELFSKGRMLPYKGGNPHSKTTTLRDELLTGDEDDSVLTRPSIGSAARKLKGLLGLRKTHIGSKKTEQERAFSGFFHHDGCDSSQG